MFKLKNLFISKLLFLILSILKKFYISKFQYFNINIYKIILLVFHFDKSFVQLFHSPNDRYQFHSTDYC